MPARYSRISWSTSSTDSRTTYLVPSTRNATVSGCASTRSIRSGLSANCSPFRRVTRITGGPLARWGPDRAGTALLSSARPALSLSRPGRSRAWNRPVTPRGDRAVRRLLQAAGVVERGEGRLAQRLAQPVGVDARDRAVVAELERLQRTHAEPEVDRVDALRARR